MNMHKFNQTTDQKQVESKNFCTPCPNVMQTIFESLQEQPQVKPNLPEDFGTLENEFLSKCEKLITEFSELTAIPKSYTEKICFSVLLKCLFHHSLTKL